MRIKMPCSGRGTVSEPWKPKYRCSVERRRNYIDPEGKVEMTVPDEEGEKLLREHPDEVEKISDETVEEAEKIIGWRT